MTSANLGDVPRLSPFLFLSLFLLNYNMVFTLIGVVQSEGDAVADEGAQRNAYILSLVFFPFLSLVSVLIKCITLCRSQKFTRSRCCKIVMVFLYDMTFVFMGTLYLAGDNLPIFICTGMNGMKDTEACRGQSSYILGVSLLLHTALHLAGTLKLRPADMPTFPVTGRIREAYQSILQLAALTIFVDQAFSTVERFVTHLDIEADETLNCGCVGNKTATNCLSLINFEIGGFSLGLYLIVLFIVIGLVVKNGKDYCSCYWEMKKPNHNLNETDGRKSKSKTVCCHCWENVCIFGAHALVIVFMVLYTLADNRWLWTCVALPNPTAGRISMLSIAFVISLLWFGVYLAITFLPGVGAVLYNENRGFFINYECATLEAKVDNSEWVYKKVFAHPRTERVSNDWSLNSREEFASSTEPVDLTDSCDRNFLIKESHGSASLSLPIHEDITCRRGCMHIVKCGFFRCCKTPNHGITCWDLLKNKCKCYKRLASEENEMIMFAYWGEKKKITAKMIKYLEKTMQNVHTAQLSDDKMLNMSGVEWDYPSGTEFYVVLKPNGESSHTTPARNSSVSPEQRENDDRSTSEGETEEESIPQDHEQYLEHIPQNAETREAIRTTNSDEAELSLVTMAEQ